MREAAEAKEANGTEEATSAQEAATAETTAAADARARRWWRRVDLSLVGPLLVMKALLFWFAAHAFTITTDRSIETLRGRLVIWNRWDAPHYLDIARDGYVATGEERLWIVFYPLYPWLVRAAAFITRDYLTGALLVSTLASVALALIFQRLVRLDETEATARGAVVFLFTFPTSYFLHIGYTESLFMALVVGSFLAARRERWWLAGALGALAGLTRVNGAILLPALLVEAFGQYRASRRFDRRWLWIPLVAAGPACYLLLNKMVTGDAFAFSKVANEHWYKTLAAPWVGVGNTYLAMPERGPSEAQMVGWEELIFVTLGLAATVWCWLELRASYSVWMALNWLLWTSTFFVLSTPRYTLILFPIYILFARLAAVRPVWGVVIIFWSLLLMGLFVTRFVQGLWAF